MASITGALDKLHSIYPLPLEDVKGIFLSFVIWTSMYVVVANMPFLLFKPQHVQLKKIDDLDVRNRMISFIHGMTLLTFSGYEFYVMPGSCGD
jgi:hypothetical protein